MTDNPCNCETCEKHKNYSCKFGLAEMTVGFTKKTGCMLHPRAREYLMRDVIDKLERARLVEESKYRASDDPSERTCRKGKNNALYEAIALIKEGVKK